MQEQLPVLPHKLTLTERKTLTLTGVTEVGSFDENAVMLTTSLGTLTIEGEGLKMKTLSLEMGQVAITGTISGLYYEESRPAGGFWHRLFG